MTDLVAIDASIRQLHARYSDAVWRKDAQAFADCFAPDGEWRISGMVMRGREAIAATIGRILGHMNRVLFTYHQPLLNIAGGEVCGRAMVEEKVSWANGKANVSIGRYFERYAEVDGRWCFTWRLFELHYRGAPDLSGEWYEHPDYGPPPAMPPLDAVPLDTSSKRWNLTE